MYYIPFVLFPVLIFYVFYNVDKTDYDEVDRDFYLLIVPAAALMVLVLTNDKHEFVFKFDHNYPIDSEVYTHNFGYFLIVGWFIVMTIFTIVYMVRHSRLKGIHKRLFIAAIPMAIGMVLSILIAAGFSLRIKGHIMYNLPEAEIFTVIAVLEGLIRVGLLPSNRQYKRFFEHSTLLAQIENNEGVIKYSSTSAKDLEQSVSVGYASHEDYKLQQMDIPGGKVYWVDDYSEINKLNREIQQITAALQEGNELKKTENKIKEDEARYVTLNSLYNEISTESSAHADKVRSILSENNSEMSFRERLSLAAIANVYIKRQSNLILLGQENGQIDSKEVLLAINESVEFLKYYGINTAVNVGKGNSKKILLSAYVAVEAYRIFQEVIDAMVFDAKACLIYFETSSKTLKIRMMIDGAKNLPDEHEHLRIEGDESSSVVTISFDRKEEMDQ